MYYQWYVLIKSVLIASTTEIVDIINSPLENTAFVTTFKSRFQIKQRLL